MSIQKRIAIFGGSFNPPGTHHEQIARYVAQTFDLVVVVPCGTRPDKQTTNDLDPLHRATMVDLAFAGIDKVRVDLFDLENATFTRTHDLQTKYEQEFPGAEIWHIIGADQVEHGNVQQSEIHRKWEQGKRLWNEFNFIIMKRPGYVIAEGDLPVHSQVHEAGVSGSSTVIRDEMYKRKSVKDLINEPVHRYIQDQHLYTGRIPDNPVKYVHHESPRVLFEVDEYKPRAFELYDLLKHFEDTNNPNLIIPIGGDGTMLRAIRKHWRLRLPFYGLNMGHAGFLLNKVDPKNLQNMFHGLESYISPLLFIETEDAQGNITEHLAFNDCEVVNPPGQAAVLRVSVNGKTSIEKMMCNGVLVSTAAGSTGYAIAAAPPLHVGKPNLIMVGIMVTMPLRWYPTNLNLTDEVEIFNLADYRPITGVVDGQVVGNVVRMKIRTSRIASARLLLDEGYNFNQKLLDKQFPQ